MALETTQGRESYKDFSRKIKLLSNLVALLPRGQGAIPRAIGKSFRNQLNNAYVVTRHGVKFVVTPDALDCFTYMAKFNWAFDYWVFDTCAALMPKEGVFYDIGANIGYMSLEMSQLKSDSRRIVSFEPQAVLVHNLRRSCYLNRIKNIEIMEACVGEVSRVARFKYERHSTHAHVDYSECGVNSSSTESIQMLALDDVVQRVDSPSPDVIKIDVEGYEFSVLQGARSIIEAIQPHIVFELSDATIKLGHRPSDFFNLLSNLGDYVFEIAVGSYRDALVISDLEAFDRKFFQNPRLTNVLARSQSRSSE